MVISFIGSGNVATHLATVLYRNNHQIKQIISRQFSHADELAKKVSAQPLINMAELDALVDMIFICVSDQQIEVVVDALPQTNAIIVHTAGSVPMQLLSKFNHHGVFYPFQTFTKQKAISFKTVPILIEANNSETLLLLQKLGCELSTSVINATSEQRQCLHLTAVLSCNFVNHLYTLSQQILSKNNLDFNLLTPLIDETTQKIKLLLPFDAQTGPACRHDTQILDKHLNLLSDNPQLQAIYKLLSDSIMAVHTK